MTSHLKVVRLAPEPKPVLDHQVPIFLEDRDTFQNDQWDLTTQQVLPYIDGFNHVARIAAEADVENNLVKSCVQNLVYEIFDKRNSISLLIILYVTLFCLQILRGCNADPNISIQ